MQITQWLVLQNYGIFLWFILSLFFYSTPGKKNIFAGVLFQVIAIYSSGNGIIAAGVIALFNIFSGNRVRIIISIGITLLFGPLYFIHYFSPPTGHPSMDILRVLIYFFRLVSAHILVHNTALAVSIGVMIMIILIALFPFNKKLHIRADILPLASFSFFLLLSMATVAFFRSGLSGIDAYSSRYLIYPHLLIALIFIFMLYRFQNEKAILPVAVGLTLLLLVPYKMNYRWGRDCLPALRHNLQSTDYYLDDKVFAKQVANEACDQKIYCIQNFR